MNLSLSVVIVFCLLLAAVFMSLFIYSPSIADLSPMSVRSPDTPAGSLGDTADLSKKHGNSTNGDAESRIRPKPSPSSDIVPSSSDGFKDISNAKAKDHGFQYVKHVLLSGSVVFCGYVIKKHLIMPLYIARIQRPLLRRYLIGGVVGCLLAVGLAGMLAYNIRFASQTLSD